MKNKKKPELGYAPECKICAGIRSRNITLQNPERAKIYSKRHNKTPGRIKYTRELNKQKIERGVFKEYAKRPEVKARKYSDKHRNHDISEQEWIACKNYFKDKDGDWCCAYCGLKIQDHWVIYRGKLMNGDFHKDHKDNDGYNDIRNCIPSCRDCNGFKHQHNMEDWYRKQEFFREDKYNKIIKWITEDYKNYIETKLPYRITKKRNKHNDKFHHELWTVDEERNTIELIAIADKKKDLDLNIQEYFKTA